MRPIFNLARRIRMASARAVVHLVNDGLKVQGVQLAVLADEVAQAQRFQEYGFSSVPLAGAEAIVLAIAGVRSHAVVVATADGRHRKKDMQPGEVALYTDEGDYILFGRGKKITIYSGAEVEVTAPNVNVSASSKVTLETPEVHCTQKLTVAGDIDCDGNVAAMQDVTSAAGTLSLTTHTHSGVTSGTEVSGPPVPD